MNIYITYMTKFICLLLFAVLVLFIFLNSPFLERKLTNDDCEIFLDSSVDKVYDIEVPIRFDIKINKMHKWYRNILKIKVSDLNSNRIPNEYKNYHEAEIAVIYKNNKKCLTKGKLRIHGGSKEHINSNLQSSLRVYVKGNISNIYNFTLFKPATRYDENEIFITALLNDLGYMSPRTFRVDVNFEGEETRSMLFQERITAETLKYYKRRSGPILSGNKNRLLKNIGNNHIGLGRISDFGGLNVNNTFHKSIFLKALDKVNYAYLHYKLQIRSNEDEKETLPFMTTTDTLFDNDKLGLDLMSSYEALMIGLVAESGLDPEERRYYYDATKDRIEPIYYDGMARILYNFDFKLNKYPLNTSIINGAKIAKLKINNLNQESFLNHLNKLGYEMLPDELTRILKLINNNLNKLERWDKFGETHSMQNGKLFSTNKSSDKYNYDLAFGGINNNFLLCNANMNTCTNKTFSDEEYVKLITNQFTKYNSKYIRYVRNNLESYVTNAKPKSSGIINMERLDLNDNTTLFHNNSIRVVVDRRNKVVNFHQIDDTGRVVIMGGIINDWIFHLTGSGTSSIKSKTDDNNLSGCISFEDVKINNISIYATNAACPDAIHFFNSFGKIDYVQIDNASGDAFDADISHLIVNELKIDGTGGECIGVKQGNYKFIKSNLINCGDRAVSSGDNAKIELDDLFVTTAKVGLAAKNSSAIIAERVYMYNVEQCIRSVMEKFNYSGSIIKTNSKSYFCDSNTFKVDKRSTWLNK
jgi:hypothetical protein